MAPRAGAAVASLKETLVKQYGASTREVVEAEVEGRLATRGGRLQREDLDAIEQSVLAAVKQRRGGAPARIIKQRSSPELVKTGAAVSSPNLIAKAGSFGSGGSGGGSVCSRRRSAPGTPAPPTPMLKPEPRPIEKYGTPKEIPQTAMLKTQSFAPGASRRPPPYGLAISSEQDDAGSERSHVVVRPRFPVPLRPKLKPMDHWDLIVAFDAEKYRQEEEAFQNYGKHERLARFRGTLDGQMDEIRDLRNQEANERRREREDMLAQIEENRRLHEAEEAKHQAQKDNMKKANDDMMRAIEERNEKMKKKKKKEEEDVTNWMNNEKARQEQERKDNAELYARKCKVAKEEMQQAQEDAARKKAESKAEAKRMAKEMEEAMDAAEAGGRQAVADRMAHIEELSRIFGAAIEKRDREAEEKLQASIQKVQEEGERLAREDAERRRSEHDAKVKNMLEARAKQVKERTENGKEEGIANKRQAEIWRKQLEDGQREDMEKEAKRRQARADLDEALVMQMRDNLVVHPLQFGITDTIRKQELAYNRVLFEQMAADGFHEEVMGGFLSKASDKGKLTPYGSVGPSKEPVHELEKLVNDVPR